MKTTIDKLSEHSWIFRVVTEGAARDALSASCVIERLTDEKCSIQILNIVGGITMQELRPKIKAKVMALGFTDYEFSRVYQGPNIKRGVR